MSTPTPEYYLKRIPLSEKDKENGYVTLDPYRIARLWELKDPALFQAFKKTLCGGQRGGKDLLQDVKEARDALQAWLNIEESGVYAGTRYFYQEGAPHMFRILRGYEVQARRVAAADKWELVTMSPGCVLDDPEFSEAEARALVEKAGGVW